MAGGVGSRLWPISRESCPKQFIKIFNNKSLMQLTLERNQIFGRPLIIITKEYHNIAAEQAKELGIEADFIIEPIGRNTAPCAIIASLAVPEGVIMLLPSDHYIENTANYIASMRKAADVAHSGKVMTFGVTPSGINTGYGYIKAPSIGYDGIYDVEQFIEKPSLEDARKYSASPEYYWNSGIFMFRSDVMINLAVNCSPRMCESAGSAFASAMFENSSVFLHQSYDTISPDSIDLAFMERAKNLAMIKADFDWHDLGGWRSLWDMHDKDSGGNTIFGDVELCDTSNSYIQSDGKLTAVIGVDDIIVINTPDASLIVHKSRADDVKHLVRNLMSKGRMEVRV